MKLNGIDRGHCGNTGAYLNLVVLAADGRARENTGDEAGMIEFNVVAAVSVFLTRAGRLVCS